MNEFYNVLYFGERGSKFYHLLAEEVVITEGAFFCSYCIYIYIYTFSHVNVFNKKINKF